MYYNQNFAPNETFQSYATIPSVLFDLLKSDPREITILENRILSTFFGSSTGVLGCTMFFSGRSALYHLLKSLELPSGSEAILQSFTCTAVATPIMHANLKPVYVDINETDFSANYDDLSSKITPSTKVVILQHSFGIIPKNRQRIIDLCNDNSIFLVEDCAHGLDPEIFHMPANQENHAVLLSFGRSKLISSVFGACIVSQNPLITNNLHKICSTLPQVSMPLTLQCLAYKYLAPIIKSSYSVHPILGKTLHKLANKSRLFPREITHGEKMGDFTSVFDCQFPAALTPILINELQKHRDITKRNKTISAFFSKSLRLVDVGPLVRYPYICDSAEQKKRILDQLASKNIILGTWYESPIAPPDCNISRFGYTLESAKKCEEVNKKIINLPLNIDQEDLARTIVDNIKTVERSSSRPSR